MTEKEKNPVKAIRAYCLGCMRGSSKEVRLCPVTECELYAFRFGKNPYRAKREYSENEKAALASRLRSLKNSPTNTGREK